MPVLDDVLQIYILLRLL